MTAIAATPARASALDGLRGGRRAIRRERELRRQIFRPPPKLTMSEWSDQHRYLSPLSSAEAGRWRTARAPFQRGIMDTMSDPTVREVIWLAPSQIGKSELLLNGVGFFIDQDPSPMLMVRPSIEDARDFSEDRVKAGLIETSPRIKKLVRKSTGRREAGNKMLRKTFPGGHLTLVGCNSPTGLANRPVRIVFFDEIDKYPPSAGDKGDPISLATNRTRTFWNRKIFKTTTPGVKGASRSEKAFANSDQRRYHVPCPHCDHKQILLWKNLKFDKATGDVFGYACEGCGVLIEERYKPQMLDRGEWIATNPNGKYPGFHINILYSPWSTWGEIVAKWLTAHKLPDTLQVFINEELAEYWDPHDGETIDDDVLKARRETYAAEIPNQVGVLVASVDVQRDWLELLVKGYGAGQESWAVAHHRLRGDTKQKAVWDRLDPLLTRPYQHEAGASLHITSCGIDSGDGETVHAVYAFVAKKQRREICPVFATKGSSYRGRPIIAGRPSKRNKYGVRVYPVGTDTAKDIIFSRLKLKKPESGDVAPPGYMHFPKEHPDGGFDDEYLEQFSRESVFTYYAHGVPYRVYEVVPDGARNEAIDLEVGALHMLHILGAGVYDQLGAWATKVQAKGARAKARTEADAAAAPSAAPAGAPVPAPVASPPPRRPPPQGFAKSWKRW